MGTRANWRAHCPYQWLATVLLQPAAAMWDTGPCHHFLWWRARNLNFSGNILIFECIRNYGVQTTLSDQLTETFYRERKRRSRIEKATDPKPVNQRHAWRQRALNIRSHLFQHKNAACESTVHPAHRLVKVFWTKKSALAHFLLSIKSSQSTSSFYSILSSCENMKEQL